MSQVAKLSYVTLGVLSFCLLGATPSKAATRASAGSVEVVTDGRAHASIVLGQGASLAYRFAATELQRYIRVLSGTEVEIIPDSQVSSRPKQETLLIVGGPAVNSVVTNAAREFRLNLRTLKSGGFVIKSGRLRDHPAVVIAGQTLSSIGVLPIC